MPISLSLKLISSVNLSEWTGFPASVRTSAGRLTLPDLASDAWHDIQGAIERLPEPIEVQPFFTDLTDRDWSVPDDDQLGAVLIPTDFIKPSNPQDDYCVAEAWPASSVLKPKVRVNLPAKPKGLVVSVGDEDIFSSKLQAVLGRSFRLGRDSVSVRGETLLSWGRLESAPTDAVLDPCCLFPEKQSPIPPARIIPNVGVFIAKPNAQAAQGTWLDELGSGFSGKRRQLGVSAENAHKIRSGYPNVGLRLLPIWRYESPTAELVREVIEDCLRLSSRT